MRRAYESLGITNPAEIECVRAYDDACPEGWAELSNGACENPDTSNGCSSEMPFRGMTPTMKVSAAAKYHTEKCVSFVRHSSMVVEVQGGLCLHQWRICAGIQFIC